MIYEFSPRQDYNGYDKPWAPGAGINKFPPVADGIYEGNGISTEIKNGLWHLSGRSNTVGNSLVLPLTDPYTLLGTEYYHLCNSVANPNFTPSLDSPADSSGGLSNAATPVNRIVKVPEAKAGYQITRIRCYLSNNIAVSGTYGPMMCDDNQPRAYSPYANICPPIGYNIYDPETGSPVEVYAGYVNAATRELLLRPVYEEYAGEALVGPWVSSMDEYTEGGTPTEGAFVVDLGGELTRYEITDFQLQSLLASLGVRLFFTNGASLLNSLMDQAQGRVRSQYGLHVHAIGQALPAGLTFKPISHEILPVFPGKIMKQEDSKNADG